MDPYGPAALRAAKQQARAAARRRTASLDAGAFAAFGAAMARHIFALPQWRTARTVFCFVSLLKEPDTAPLLVAALDAGKRLCLPRLLDAPGQMELVAVPSLDTLTPRRLGILEPCGGTVVDAAALTPDTLAIIPCVAAGRDGTRLGHGGGYYDRFLKKYAATGGARLLLCPTPLLFETLPTGPLDAAFSPCEVLTEQGLLAL